MAQERISTGVPGLDDVLCGGLAADRLYLVEGVPGTGKTTLAFQFLLEGVRLGEPVLYVSLSETQAEIRDVAASHGWSLDGITVRELVPSAETLDPGEQYTVFHPSEVELSETTERIVQDVQRVRPRRVVFDSLSELRLLAGAPLRYRRQILALKQFFAGRSCTVLLLDDLTSSAHDLQVQSISHGALLLNIHTPAYGGERRRISITKFRGSPFRGGYHDYVIRQGGMAVFPRLIAAESRTTGSRQRVSSGLPQLDLLLGGGLERGTSTLIQGPAGTGKSTIATLFAVEAARRGEKSVLYIFDESVSTLASRMAGLGHDLRGPMEQGLVTVRQVDPAEMSPGELAQSIRHAVQQDGVTIVTLDSLNGYLNSMPDEKFMIVQMHELLTWLGQHGVASILVAAQPGMFTGPMVAPLETSYLADSVVLMRYFEVDGEVRQALSVVKMRGSDHERTLRQFATAGGRILIGEPLRHYHGVLTGVPQLKGPR